MQNNPPPHAHSWHNLRFANNGQPRGQSMMQLNRTSGAAGSAAVANAFISAEGSWSSQQGNSSWDPVPIGGRGLTNLLQNNPLFAGLEGAMNRSAAAHGNSNHPPSQRGDLVRNANQISENNQEASMQQPQKRQKIVSFATLSGAAQDPDKHMVQPPNQQGNAVFPTQQLQHQLQKQAQARKLAHAARSTPNFSTHSSQSNNAFLSQHQSGASMQNASFQGAAQSHRTNPFFAQLQGASRNQNIADTSSKQINLTNTEEKGPTASGKPHQFASIFDDSKPSPLAQMRQQTTKQQPLTQTNQSLQPLEPSRKRPAPANSSFRYGYASTFARESANNPKLLFASIDGSSLLHNSCKLYPDTVTVVESAIAMDPEAVRRPISIVCCMKGVGEKATDGTDKVPPSSSSSTNEKQPQQSRKQRAQERFHYPLNIALKYNACYEIISLLAEAGPDVIALPDGPDRCTALATAIALERDARVIQLLLETNPEAAQVCDRQSNTPLHAAIRVSKPSPPIVELVYHAYPKALYEHNFHGETPLDMAVRNHSCSEEVLNFFQLHRDGDLEKNLQDDLV